MADKSEKVVILAEVDPRGVVSGVNATNRELSKLNRTAKRGALAAGISAGYDAAQAAYGLIMQVVNMIDKRVQQMNAMALKYSPEAMIANANLQATKIQSEVAIGQAIGTGTAKGAQIEQAALQERARNVQANAGALSGGIAAWESMKQSFADAGTAFSDSFITSLGDPSAQGPISAMLQNARTFEYLTGQVSGTELGAGLGSARGMPYETNELNKQTVLLEQIAKQTRGN